MSIKRVATLGLGFLLVGLLAGYLFWGLPTQKLADEIGTLKARITEEAQRVAEVQSKLADAESERRQLVNELNSERDIRRRLEDLLNRGRK